MADGALGAFGVDSRYVTVGLCACAASSPTPPLRRERS
jgi:hypothetical protein